MAVRYEPTMCFEYKHMIFYLGIGNGAKVVKSLCSLELDLLGDIEAEVKCLDRKYVMGRIGYLEHVDGYKRLCDRSRRLFNQAKRRLYGVW